MSKEVVAFFLLRAAIASVFLYAAIAAFIDPDNWVVYFPLFLQHLMPEIILISVFSLYELFLAVWLLSGLQTFFAALLATLTLGGIIFTNFSLLDILFRDFSIILAAVSLAIFSYKKKK